MNDTKLYLCELTITDPPFRVLIEAEGPMLARKRFFEAYLTTRRVDAVETIKIAKGGTPIIELQKDQSVTDAGPEVAEKAAAEAA